ncbi:MAG: cytochrome C [Desulfuromonadaceae bacterium]|nr:cytochrome C [Desulfuromonadaceae bacterium]
MEKMRGKPGLLTATVAAGLVLVAGTSFAAHPPVTLYTFEEIGMQMAGGQPVPVQVDASGKGMPYSPKATCGTSGCHSKNGVDMTYDKISDHAFHSAQGRNEFPDTADGKFDPTKNKPWTQSNAMVGKW